MKKEISLLFCIVIIALSTACKPEYTPTTLDGFTQGTTYHIVIRDNVPKNVDIQHGIDSIFLVMEQSMSLYDPNSLLSRINRNETDSLDRYIIDCIRIAERLSRESGGLFDITVKPLTSAYGFTGEGTIQMPDVDSLLQYVGYEKIRIENGRLVKSDPGVQIDLNAVAQGYTVDVVADYFDKLGLENYLVEMGGEIFSRGHNARDEEWTVQIDRPVEGNYVQGAQAQVVIHLSEQGLATSGNYRKFYTDEAGRKIVHTVNPLTGEPVVSSLLSATVVAPDATLADIYGTYFMVVGLEKSLQVLMAHPELDAFLIWSDDEGDYQVYATEGMKILK